VNKFVLSESRLTHVTSMSVLVILERKCTLAASRAAPGDSRCVFAVRPIKVGKKMG